jgi:uracil-DNA glycosylase
VVPAPTITAHCVVNVTALDVKATKAGSGGDMWVGASGAKVEAGTIDKVTIREAEVWVARDSVCARPSVQALETEQLCVMRWAVERMIEFSGKALIECL